MIITTRPPGLDKDELAVRGNKIVVAYDDNFNTWASVSLDGGKSWATHEVFPTSEQFSISLAAGAGIDSQGNIFISWDSFDKAHRKAGHGPATLWVSKSSDNGLHWTRTVINVSHGAAPNCNPCGFDYLSSQMALRIGSDDTIYLLWNASVDSINFSPERIYFSRSTWGASALAAPAISQSNEQQFSQQARIGFHAGDDWEPSITADRYGHVYTLYKHYDVSGQQTCFVPGYSYLSAAGFNLPYGDYFSMAVDDNNNTQAAFGEGPNYQGPGNIWVSHSRLIPTFPI